MEFIHCPECRGIKMFQDGKCMVCGYISSVRQSINYLYSPKKDVGLVVSKSNVYQGSSSDYVSRSSSTGTDIISTSVAAALIFSDCGSSGSDGSCH
jgi:hypothetical protein